MSNSNPLLNEWTDNYGLPPFDAIRPEHWEPAFDMAFTLHRHEVEAIADNKAEATFDNTVAALDRSGRLLARVGGAFFNLVASLGDDALQEIETRVAPRMAAHQNSLYLNHALFGRIDSLHARRAELGLSPVDLRLLERIHLDFVLAGAKLDAAAKEEYARVTERQAELCTTFSQHVLGDESEWIHVLSGPADLEGLPADLVSNLAEAASQRGKAGSHALVLTMSIVEDFLTHSSRRDLREIVWRAWTSRGLMKAERNTLPVIKELLTLRHEQARLHGYPTYARYALVDRMAKTPEAVAGLLERIWQGALVKVADEEAQLSAHAAQHGQTAPLEPWDWLYWAEKIRKSAYELDEAAIKPYFELDRMMEAMFWCAGRLFGLEFTEKKGIPVYHPDVRVFEVRDASTGFLTGIFIMDNFSRPGKRGGAWMSTFREQSIDARGNRVVPLVINNNNIAKAAEGQPTLLSFDAVTTMFHEFGHGLHGLLSSIEWERLSGTNVLQDFVELPSQIFEHWVMEKEVLAKFATHAVTGETIPSALVDRIKAARQWNQGYTTIRIAGSALLDMALHARSDFADLDLMDFQAQECARLKVPKAVGIRHELPYFRHLFADSAYAAGYYVYLWAEVLDADGYHAFREAGDPFDPAVAERLKRFVYAAGDSADPAELYRSFRGRDPRVEALLAERGLTGGV